MAFVQTGLRCPSCDELIDAAKHVSFDDAIKPKPGDYGVCFYCAQVLEYIPEGIRAAEMTIDLVAELAPVITAIKKLRGLA